ncbi:conserved oligomeric Golgi complex subunit 2 isoform X1 [Paramormyrops kingsleyae]|uniref:Conserved oligomeric Golgi complex subunit 2 n=1 Tax=Paramormyrops kingsleyae TaxID=1676925 RepID=A0A3B3RST1_9TELE|nr:conserved oligomeric Golgi complex subunit 2 isoform X1 [Paramormyrops kingsleyae]
MNLPKGPDALCFDREVFMKDDFDVDHFVAECRKRVQLEEMREDLELYYKLLKTAMVELINKDYADFVNLSTNLAGMDKTLSQLSVPLGQLREEVLSLRSSVHEVIEAIDERLCKQDDIQKKKMCVLRLIQVVRSVEKIEKILHTQSSKDTASPEVNSPPLAGQILERIATEFNQLQFHAVQSKGMPLVDRVRPRIAGITAMLQQSLEGLLVEGLRTSSVDMVRHCLRTYATIDKTRDAEALVGQALVKPYVEEVVVEQCTKSGPPALQNMYGKLLEFGPHHCRLLREVTGGAISSDKADIVPGYDFMVNSVWPEMVRALEERAPSLFSPGNPDVFYEKYTISMEFVRRFERQCGSQASVRRLRAHSAYKSFQNKWNLPVYFQLRYKEIAGSLENAITECLVEAPAGGAFRLHVSHMLWTCLLRCWAEGVYLPQLAHRFWKLTLQLLSRYSTFMMEVLTRVPAANVGKEPPKPLPSSASSTSSRTSQEDTGSEAAGPTALTSRQMAFVMADLDTLQEKIPELSDIIRQKLELIGFTSFTMVSESLADSQAALSSCIPAVSRQVTQHLGERCFSYLRSASEVPRLYRRTNKEVPTRASAYVDSALRPLLQLQSDFRDMLRPPIIEEWLRITLCDCTQRYHETISDVLSSVKKMEESLKRLKQARKTATSNPAGSGGGPTDDSKIRLQLALDVEYLGEQIQKMGLQPSDVTLFPALLELVQGARDTVPSEAPAPQSTQPAGL